MSILKVARIGHPVLRERAREAPADWWKSPESQQFIRDMIDTMHEYQGVGLAAPQVHQSIRVAIVEIHQNPRYPNAPACPLTVVINPVVISMSEERSEDWEGCLSVPDLRGRLQRAESITLDAMDETGNSRRITANGWVARAFQHELDHLDGKVYIDRMTDLTRLSYLEEFARYHDED